MKNKYIVGFLTFVIFSLGLSSLAVPFKIEPPPNMPSGQKVQPAKKRNKPNKEALGAIVKPQYPQKYTETYVAEIKDEYKAVGKDEVFYVALDMLKGTNGEFSRQAILGKNLTSNPIKIEFRDLGLINKNYANFDALGWKKKNKLYIYINEKHTDAPAIALAALLSHEALHQDEYNSLHEETYAWTMEAAVWCELLELYPDYEVKTHPLVTRENTLKQLFEKGDYTSKYIKKTVYSNKGYQNLPESSPGFEDL